MAAPYASAPQAGHSISSPYPNSSTGFRPLPDQVGITSFSSSPASNREGEASNTGNVASRLQVTSPHKAPPPEYGSGGSVPTASYMTTNAEISTAPNFSSGTKCIRNRQSLELNLFGHVTCNT